MDGRAQRKLHVRRARPRPCDHRRDGAGCVRQFPGAAREHRSATWAPIFRPSRPRCRPTSTRTLLAGVYKTPAIYVEVKAIFTNTVPVDAYRGAGRPEATFLLERLVDAVCHDTGADPLDIRRKNFIPTDAFPYQTPVALQYDSGNYFATLDAALKQADYAGFTARKAAAKAKGKLRGIGVSTYLEACGIAPSKVVGSLGARAGLYEVANIRVHPTGSVSVFTGTHSHGQGHETTLAQLVSDQLGIPHRAGGYCAWRYREDSLRHGHLRQPQPRGRRQRHGEGDGQDHREGKENRGAPDGSVGR